MPKKKKTESYVGVLVVHGNMTGDGKHGVSWRKSSKSKKVQYKSFSNWRKAKQFASKKTLQLKQKKYIVDDPPRLYDVTAKKQSKKRRKRKRKRKPKGLAGLIL